MSGKEEMKNPIRAIYIFKCRNCNKDVEIPLKYADSIKMCNRCNGNEK